MFFFTHLQSSNNHLPPEKPDKLAAVTRAATTATTFSVLANTVKVKVQLIERRTKMLRIIANFEFKKTVGIKSPAGVVCASKYICEAINWENL